MEQVGESSRSGAARAGTGAASVRASQSDDASRLARLRAWAAARHIWVHEGADIRVVGGTAALGSAASQGDHAQEEKAAEEATAADGAGFGVFASAREGTEGTAIGLRQVVVLTPKRAILSARTSSIAPHLPANILFTSNSTAGLLLALVLLHEYLLGTAGPWWDYLQSLPHALAFPAAPPHAGPEAPPQLRQMPGVPGSWGVPIPLLWSAHSDEWRWIAGAESARMVQRANADPRGKIEGNGMSLQRIHDYFAHTALPVLRKSQAQLFAGAAPGVAKQLRAEFERAYSIVSSRAFVVDMYHGLALVPIADMFNHVEGNNMQFEADDVVCDECGALGACPHSNDPLPSEAYGRPSSYLPATHGPNSASWQPPPELRGVDTADMVARVPIAPGDELFNSYGYLSNATLLTTYGFALAEETEWERFAWEWRIGDERRELADALALGEGRPDEETIIERRRSSGSASMLNESGKRRGSISVAPATPSKRSRGDATALLRRRRWLHLCASYAGLPLSTFDELLIDPPRGGARGHQFDAEEAGDVELLTLPYPSPLGALTRRALAPDADADDDSSDADSSAGEASPRAARQQQQNDTLSALVAPLSKHEGSSDARSPLFIDGEGRVSLPLWRVALLGALAEAALETSVDLDPTEAQEETARRAVWRAEAALEAPDAQLDDVRCVDKALGALHELVEGRRQGMRIARDSEEEAALRIIETEPMSPLRSAATQAFQELAALRACLSRLSEARRGTQRWLAQIAPDVQGEMK